MLLRTQTPESELNQKIPIEIDQDTELWAEVTGFVRTELHEEWILNPQGIEFANTGEFESSILSKRDNIFTLKCYCGHLDRQVEFNIESSEIATVSDYQYPFVPRVD